MPFMFFIYCTINSLNFVDGTYQNICVLKVLTAFLQRSKKLQIAEVRAVQSPSTLWKRCAVAINAVETL